MDRPRIIDCSVLSEPTLVLNRSWLPVRVCSVRRALVLVYKDLARCIGDDFATYDFAAWARLAIDRPRFVQTVSKPLRVPEIILLKSGHRYARPRVAFSRRNLFRRDRHTCQYCGKRFPSHKLSVDHVIPRSHGGPSSWTNCVAACTRCNARKADRRLEQTGMRTLRPPAEPPADLALTYHVGRPKSSWLSFVRGHSDLSAPGSSADRV